MTTRNPAAAALVAAFALLSSAAHAEESIASDRPDFVESSDVVGPGRVQIETGFSSERQKADGTRSRLTLTPTLLRLGFSETMEFRVETDGFARSRMDGAGEAGASQRERGFSDAALGVKWHLQDVDDAGGRPGMALLVSVDLDSGSAAFRGQGVRPALRGVAEWELPNDFSIGVMPGIALDRNADGKRFAYGLLALTLGKQLTPAVSGFVEIAGQQLASKKNGGSVVTFDTGVTWLVNNDLQLDFSVMRGLTDESPDFQWGVGFSYRF